MKQTLPTTSIERFHLYDDYPRFPNTIGCQLLIKGQLDLELANKALRTILTRHFLGTAPPDSKFKNWVFDSELLVRKEFELIDSGEQIVAVPIDPRRDGGCRFLWQPTDTGLRLLLVVHHAAADGQGGLQFLIDWMTAYHNLTNEKQIKLRKLDSELLNNRNRSGIFSKEFLSRIWLQPIAVFGSAKFMARKIAAMGSPDNEEVVDETKDDYPATELINIRLDESETEALRRIAESQDRTINELLLRDIFLAIHEFRVTCDLHEPEEWLRLVVPMSIRTYSDRRMPSVNRATIVQLDRTDKDFLDADQLAWGINYELGNIRRWQLDKTFLLVLKMFSRIPGRLKKIAQKPVCRATMVVTNLAAPLERLKLPRKEGKIVLGDATVEEFDLVAPLRPLTPVAIAISKYASELKLSIHFHSECFNRKDAELFVEHTIRRLDQTLESEETS